MKKTGGILNALGGYTGVNGSVSWEAPWGRLGWPRINCTGSTTNNDTGECWIILAGSTERVWA